jgi:hypothetical protein
MEIMSALSGDCIDSTISDAMVYGEGVEHTQAAVIAWVFACRACAIEMNLTDTADIIVGDVPSPCSYRMPLPDCDLHVDIGRDIKTLIALD